MKQGIITPDEHTDSLLYASVAAKLTEEIESGRIEAGERLPNEAELQAQFRVSRVTVRRALKILQDRGLIQRFRRRGSFVIDQTIQTTPLFQKQERSGCVQFLHTGVPKGILGAFSHREFEAAERYFAGKDMAISWSLMESQELVDGRKPTGVEQGVCDGLLVDGKLTSLHLSLISRFNLPFVVLSNHDISDEWHQVRYKVDAIVEGFIETAKRKRADVLVAVTKENSFLEQRILELLSASVIEHGYPPLRILPEAMVSNSGFLEMLEKTTKRCLIKLPGKNISDMAHNLERCGKAGERHSLITVGYSGSIAPHVLPQATVIELEPYPLVTRAAEILDSLIKGPTRPPIIIEMEPTLLGDG